MCGKCGDLGEGQEEEYKSEEDRKGKNKPESDEDKIPLNQIFRLSTGGKGVVEGKERTTFSFDILPYPHCGEFTISPFHYMNWFTISPFHHSVCVSFHHFTISVHLSYIISLNKLSHHLTHHLYQYYIFTDHLSYYSESDEIGVNMSSHKCTKAAKKYETSLHITPASLDNLPNLNSNRPNIYATSKMFKEFVAANMPLARTMRRRGVCVYALNHGYGV